jgi:uncharacterized damage-inducible protein DinB
MVVDAAPLPGYPEPYGLLSAMLKDATAEWRGELPGDLGPEVTTWRARPGGASIGGIVLHMIAVEIYWLECFALGRPFDPEEDKQLLWHEIDVDESIWPEVPHQPLSWYFALHDHYRTRTLESIKQWPPADTLIGNADGTRHRSLRWVLGHVIQHEAYHGGQIVTMVDLWRNREA